MNTKFKDILNAYIKSDPKQTVGLFQLGLMYLYGTKYPQDINKGLNLINEAGKEYPTAYTFLGLLYLENEFVEKDVTKAIKYLEKASKLNDDKALINLSNIYLTPEFNLYNPRKAMNLLKKAALLNSPEALLHLGVMYLGNSKLPSDYEEAYNLINKSSKLGNANANAFLGLMYENGYHFPVDNKKALKYYLKATSGNSSIAHLFLGRLYLKGEIVRENTLEAINHLTLAAEFGHVEAINLLIDIYLDSEKNYYSPEKGLVYLEQLISYSEPYGLYLKGKFLIEGKYYKQNIKQGLKYIRQAKTAEAYIYLGNLYTQGFYVNHNNNLALLYYLKGSEMGSSKCMVLAAEVIINEKINIDFIRLIKLGMKLKNPDAYYLMAQCYRDGKGVSKNLNKTFEYAKQAALLNSPKGLRLLGSCFLIAMGTRKDLEQAILYLKQADDLNDEIAPFIIGKLYWHNDTPLYNLNLAKAYFTKAANRRYGDAYYFLSLIDEDNERELLKQGFNLGSPLCRYELLKIKKK